tara:strand:- start:504 stop:791 length:288 start_codon:yes stop_codon:yes gene_type:complete
MLVKKNESGQNFIWIEPCAGADTPEARQEAIKQTNAMIKKMYDVGDGEFYGFFEYSEKTCLRYVYSRNGSYVVCVDGGEYFPISNIDGQWGMNMS